MGQTVEQETEFEIGPSEWSHGTYRWDDESSERVDWAASCRLALVVSIVAAMVALALVSVIGETSAILLVIVAATATSWFHLEQGQLTRPATIRRD